MAISATNVMRVDKNKIAEHWVNSDSVGTLSQLRGRFQGLGSDRRSAL